MFTKKYWILLNQQAVELGQGFLIKKPFFVFGGKKFKLIPLGFIYECNI